MTNGPAPLRRFMLMPVWCVRLAACLYLHTPASEGPSTSLRAPLYLPAMFGVRASGILIGALFYFLELKAMQWSVSKGNPSPCA